MNDKHIIWQYWETKGFKPLFVDELHEIAKKNSGAEVVLVTPETIQDYIPNIPDEIFQIKELAHKADMIRALLIYHHGGMWLDSDAIVLSSLIADIVNKSLNPNYYLPNYAQKIFKNITGRSS